MRTAHVNGENGMSVNDEPRGGAPTFLGCNLPTDRALIDRGWQWRGNIDDEKLSAIVEFYEDIGFEVRLEAIKTNCLSTSCKGCEGGLAITKAVYVRQKG